jgi:hypothetical protein
MGKVVKTVLKVAAGVAIAAFAPQLAGAMLKTVGVGGALASTVATAAVGAGLGQVSGLGWQTGALLGGLAGAGKSGLFGGTSQTATAAGGAGAPAAGVAPATATTTAPVGGVAGTAADTASRVADAARAAGTAAAPQTLGSTLSGAASKVGNVLQQGVSNVRAGVGGALGAVGIGGGAATAAGAAGAGGGMGIVAPALLAAGLVRTPGGAITGAQQAELARAQQMNAALTQQRLDQANKLIEEAGYYDPEYMARQAAEAAMIRGGIQETEGTRGLTGERLAAERRRYRLGTARTAGAAYQQGYGTGVGARLQARQAGIQSLPSQYPTTSAESSAALRDRFAADEARRAEEAGLAALFGQALGRPATT